MSFDRFMWVVSGVSGKSVLLYAIVFTCRYLDLFTHFVSLYNSVMKVIYLVSTYFTLYLIYRKFKPTYDRNHDTFRIEFLLLPSAVLALLWNHEFSILEVNSNSVFQCFVHNHFHLFVCVSSIDFVDIFNLSGICCYSSSIIYG